MENLDRTFAALSIFGVAQPIDGAARAPDGAARAPATSPHVSSGAAHEIFHATHEADGFVREAGGAAQPINLCNGLSVASAHASRGAAHRSVWFPDMFAGASDVPDAPNGRFSQSSCQHPPRCVGDSHTVS